MRASRFVISIAGVLALTAVSIVGSSSPVAAQTAALTSAQIYERTADAIVIVETPIGGGSGILIGPRRIVTDAHVVEPFETVEVRFRNGTVVRNAQVVGVDVMADLAVVQLPNAVSFAPVVLGSSSRLVPGEQLYMIGYPESLSEGIQPAISFGLLSRIREWEAIGMTYLETDAEGGPGVSGGAVVTADGTVVGVIQFQLYSGFLLAAAGDVVADRVQGLVAGQDVDGTGNRTASGPPLQSHAFTLDDFVDETVFAIPDWISNVGITVRVDSVADTIVGLIRTDGYIVATADENVSGRELLAAVLPAEPIPHHVVVRQFGDAPASVTLTSNVPLIAMPDVDDNHILRDGDVYFGALDHPIDRDWFLVDLQAGGRLTALVESVAFDTVAVVDDPANPVGELAYDDDSGGGLFGVNSLLEFTAPTAGRYRLIVYPYASYHGGGYVVSVTVGQSPVPVGPVFSAPLPGHGVGLTVYAGGTISQLIYSASGERCDLSSFWVSEGGQLIGYVVGAPAFVNEAMLWMFPGGQIPERTPMLLSCA